MTAGWLGEAYLWVKAAHIILVIFWMAGMFLMPRYLVHHCAATPGSPEDAQWIAREAQLMRIIVNPSMVLVWLLGLALAFNLGWQGGWLHAKLLIVLGFSGYHGWLAATRKRFAQGQRPYAQARLRLLGEVPALVTIAVVLLAVVKPF